MSHRNAANFSLLGAIVIEGLVIGAIATHAAAATRIRTPISPVVRAASPARAAVIGVAAKTKSPAYAVRKPAAGQIGVASWYGKALQDRPTASGRPFDAHKLTAAHRTLPLNSRVRVVNLTNGRSVKVTITDRGPYVRGRTIDLSAAAAKRIGMKKRGLTRVRIERIPPPAPVEASGGWSQLASAAH